MIICTMAHAVTQHGNYFSVQTDGVEIRLMFLTDSILRIRAGFDGDFAEESYSLVLTAWEDRMDDFMKKYRPNRWRRGSCHSRQAFKGRCGEGSIPYLRI